MASRRTEATFPQLLILGPDPGLICWTQPCISGGAVSDNGRQPGFARSTGNPRCQGEGRPGEAVAEGRIRINGNGYLTHPA
ncbi:hypothetical protein AXG93_1175s1400 [Marchantia polymorpha subsp. ruderalis]|uniref:Uncharacterized protein n=1 Tax=Marchantia polymorpha subsp. ruderalis TaxID=1480154 RepID=A0A176VMP0_MARPO|nr:hypothetical protein AXG93_1175s1400 [Marchantia polymorpha subsp. ruderalis]